MLVSPYPRPHAEESFGQAHFGCLRAASSSLSCLSLHLWQIMEGNLVDLEKEFAFVEVGAELELDVVLAPHLREKIRVVQLELVQAWK